MTNMEAVDDRSRRDRLLESALELFAENGYAGTSVKAIAQQANVSQGLLYVHFENKATLLVALLEQGMADVASTLEVSASITGLERLDVLLRNVFALMQTNRDFWRLFYTLRFQPAVAETLGPAIHTGITTIREQLIEVCSDLQVAHPELEARLLFGAIDGICQHAALEPDYPFEDVLKALLGKYQEAS